MKIQGGLGNQLFQYAFVRALSERYKILFKVDTTSYDFEHSSDDNPDKIFQRGFGLPLLNTKLNIATNDEIKYFKKYKRRNGKIWYPYNKLIADKSLYVQELQFEFGKKYAYPPTLKKGDSAYFDGFWQTERYFKEIEQIIHKEFSFRNAPDKINAAMLKKIANTESVCLHVRHGNFLIPKYKKHHGVCSINYYKKAMDIIEEHMPNPTFFVFSDNKEWVKQNIKSSSPIIFVDNNGPEKDYEDLRLMSTCKHHIIANSSFSWWGAWLSKNKNKIVIVPSQIFKKKWNISDYAPPQWIRVKTKLV